MCSGHWRKWRNQCPISVDNSLVWSQRVNSLSASRIFGKQLWILKITSSIDGKELLEKQEILKGALYIWKFSCRHSLVEVKCCQRRKKFSLRLILYIEIYLTYMYKFSVYKLLSYLHVIMSCYCSIISYSITLYNYLFKLNFFHWTLLIYSVIFIFVVKQSDSIFIKVILKVAINY